MCRAVGRGGCEEEGGGGGKGWWGCVDEALGVSAASIGWSAHSGGQEADVVEDLAFLLLVWSCHVRTGQARWTPPACDTLD